MTTPSSRGAHIDVPCDETLVIEPAFAATCAPPVPVHVLFAEQAQRTPAHGALQSPAGTLTYAELNAAAENFAGRLLASGVTRGELIGLFVERGPASIVAILGILKAGAAYLPLDPAYPAQRLQFMLGDARPRGIVVSANLRSALDRITLEPAQVHDSQGGDPLKHYAPHIWEVTADLTAGAADQREAVQPDLSRSSQPDDLAYAIYTSGSTGRPKAALLTHRGLQNLCEGQQAFFPVTAESRVLQFASLSFDASVSEIFVTLTCGATLCLVNDGDLAPSRLAETLNKLRISVATIPPSVLTALDEVELPWLKTLVTAGESCPLKLVQHFAGRHRMVNAYGPTEATVCATMHACDATASGPPPIGPAMPGCEIYILNDQQQECCAGETGEMYLGGIGLAQGYLNRPELTAEKFLTLRLHSRDVRLYRTGDLARRREDGVFEFVGRRDHQVKIRGVRIELGELEHALQQHPYVDEAIVTVEEQRGAKRLVAHVAGGNGVPLSSPDVLAWLRSRVTPAMLPSEVICRRTMPLLPNGKIDRKALHRAADDQAALRDKAYSPQAGSLQDQQTVNAHATVPRDRFELATRIAFEEILELPRVELDGDFFILGGDSLQAMDLLARLETEFGIAPSMADLMQNSTVSGLASTLATLQAQAADAGANRLTTFGRTWNPLVPLTPQALSSSARPLYCIHPGGGNALCFLDLARRLSGDRPVIGLNARGLEPGQEPLMTVEDIAEEYLAAIREHQPEGPYAIAGWSFGGIVAFEMACRLQQLGEDVEHLGIIDIGLLYSFGVLTTLFPEGDLALFELRRLPPDDQIREFSTRTAAAKLIPPGASPELARRIYDTFMANVDAMMNYRPEHYAGRMTIYRAGEPLVRLRRELVDEWREFCDDIEVCTVAGNHLTMIHEPQVAELAGALRQRLS